MSLLTEYDDSIRMKYGQILCGCDEVGRGAFAGPLCAAAVILPASTQIPNIKDSKALKEATRKYLAEKIKDVALSFAIVEVDADVIDEHGIDWANRYAMNEACKIATSNLSVDMYIVDHSPGFDLSPCLMLAKADSKSECVAAASIIAKDHRDQIMIQLDEEYPGYDFKKSKGYVSKAHVAGAKLNGIITSVHRKSFKVKGVTVPEQNLIWDYLDSL